MFKRNLGVLIVAVALAIAGFLTLPSPAQQTAEKPAASQPTDASTRIFSGYCVSKAADSKDEKYPCVVVVYKSENKTACKLVFFVDKPIAVPFKVEPSADAKEAKLSGTLKDPRGFEIKFAATLKDGKIEGTYSQPHDNGEFSLTEVE